MMKTLGEVILLAGEHLAQRGIERARREAEELIADQLHCKRIDLFLQFDRILSDAELAACRDALRKRAAHLPLAYISGRVEFGGVALTITPDVLIPRPETERLVEMIVGEASSGKLLDLCCGSGALGLALKKQRPDLEVTLADLSPAALEVTRKNAEMLGLEVTIVQSDLFSALDSSFDWIVCNPPYLSEADYLVVTPEVKQEPKMALVAGSTGYEVYERLAQEMRAPRAWLEIGTGMGRQAQELFRGHGYHCEVIADYAGHDRYLSLRR